MTEPRRFVFLSSSPAGAIIQAKMACVPVRRGYWGNKIGKVRPLLPAAPAAGASDTGCGAGLGRRC
jgi:hypothetical protein